MNSKVEALKCYILIPVALAVVLLACIFLVAVMLPCDAFHSSYQSVIQDKYDNLIETEEPKIILIGGSNLGFGIDESMLSNATGYPVVNLGLHAGFGGLFNTEIAKANIDEGDIILLGYEYGWQEEGYFDKFGVDLVMSGINSQVEMYQYVPLCKWVDIIGYIPDFLRKKVENKMAAGTYSRSSFDDNGHMVLQREFALQEYEEKIDYYKYISLDNTEISGDSIQYLKAFKEYATNKGANVYFIAPPLYEKAKKSDDASFLTLAEEAEREIGIKYISNPLDYVYPAECIYDTIYHCSSQGEQRRTEQLITDLYENRIIEMN